MYARSATPIAAHARSPHLAARRTNAFEVSGSVRRFTLALFYPSPPGRRGSEQDPWVDWHHAFHGPGPPGADGSVPGRGQPGATSVKLERPLVVASNRGPISFERGEDGELVERRGAGGLVTALTGALA